MAIRYIHNDPGIAPVMETVRSPLPNRVGSVAKLKMSAAPPEQVFPQNDDPGFVYWQCREASLLALSVWEHIDRPLPRWQSQSRVLALHHDHPAGLEASYDRSALAFSRWDDSRGTLTFPGASTDAVAHEVGHAVLDAVRPEFWDSYFSEVAAFHEAFADCLALLVSLFDDEVRRALVANAPAPQQALDTANPLATIAESVAQAFQVSWDPKHPNTRARSANNQLQWVLPVTLPPTAPAGHLSQEPHSFGQIFTGCFYDTVNNIYKSLPAQDEAALFSAAETAGRLLAVAAGNAAPEKRYFRGAGAHMILADNDQNGGANHLAIRDAFGAHGVALGSSTTLAPTMALAGPPPTVTSEVASSRGLSAKTRSDLCKRIGVPSRTRITLEPMRIGATRLAKAQFQRDVLLSGIHRKLRGVVARSIDAVQLGAHGKRCAVLGHLSDGTDSEEEISAFVEGLIGAGALILGSRKQATRARRPGPDPKPSHAVRKIGSKKRVTRVRFSCLPPGLRWPRS